CGSVWEPHPHRPPHRLFFIFAEGRAEHRVDGIVDLVLGRQPDIAEVASLHAAAPMRDARQAKNQETFALFAASRWTLLFESTDHRCTRMTAFADLGAPEPLAVALAARGYEIPTPVQEAVLEAGTGDLLVSARTGSGKTVAFGLAIAQDLLPLPKPAKPLALVVAPTRELAHQVVRELSWLLAPGRVATTVGGADVGAELRALRGGVHVVVGTPGRLVDHLERGSLQLDSLRVLVLDEADEMLDLGFRDELERILESAPEERRTLLFSATIPHAIEALARKYTRHAKRIAANPPAQAHADI